MPSLYQTTRTVLREVVPETDTIKTFRLEPQSPLAFKAGQFVELTVPGLGEAPFTPSSRPGTSGGLALTVMRAGRVTGALHGMQAGTELGVRGPYGNVYPLDDYEDRNILIMGGGVGLAPLRSLLYALLEQRERFGRIILCYGAKTPSDLLYRNELNTWVDRDDLEVVLTVDEADESWEGKEGVVTKTLEEVEIDAGRAIAVVCGPPIMMKFSTYELSKRGFLAENTYLSMERKMCCGVGKCGHCRIGHFYVCRDGPVFTLDQLEDVPNLW